MKTRFSKHIGILCLLCWALWALAPRSSAQTTPSLGLRFSAGQPTLSLTGEVGTVYSIQSATGLSPTNLWADRTLLQSKGASDVWTDRSAPSTGQRFYRAVSVPASSDVNLVFIQPGTFTMGSPTNEVGHRDSEGPQTAVTISCGFWMGKYLVTQGDYLAVMGSNPSYFYGVTRPVERVSWFNASNYCAKLTQQERVAGRIPTNCVYRLSTEAEWEYACRAGTTTRFSYGDDPGYTSLTDYAWFLDNSGNMTQPVGQKLPNPWGLYDMHGNLYEWCQDWFDTYPGGSVIDPQGPVTQGNSFGRVIRGGYWGSDRAQFCRSAARVWFDPQTSWYDWVGFRVLVAPGQ